MKTYLEARGVTVVMRDLHNISLDRLNEAFDRGERWTPALILFHNCDKAKDHIVRAVRARLEQNNRRAVRNVVIGTTVSSINVPPELKSFVLRGSS